jgi:hypothetical protein
MANDTPQSFANHSKTPTPIIVHTVLLIAAVGLGAAGLVFRDQPLGVPLITLSAIATPVVLILALLSTRFQLLCLQDRIIRLEMRVRLSALLPAEKQQEAMAKLTSPQLIALRFAADAELPGLVTRVLDGSLRGAKAIKAEIKDWQPDTNRV